MIKKTFIRIGIGFVLLQSPVLGQSLPLTKTEKQYKRKVLSLFSYIQKTPFEDINQDKLFRKYITYYVTDTIQVVDLRRKKMFNLQLKRLDAVLDTLQLKELDAVPWNKFDHKENLPRLLWQAEPITHLFGQPLAKKSTNRELVVEEGKKQLENTLIVFRKDAQATPRYFILFDEKSNKIVSWTLLNQGGLHYFLPF